MPVQMLYKKARKNTEAQPAAHGVDDYTWIDPGASSAPNGCG